jgi:putative hemolysin
MAANLVTAFIANDSGNEVLVCSSSDGSHWTGNLNIGQASKFAPSLVEFNTEYWLAFVANDAGNEVLVCSSPDGTHWTRNLNIGQAGKSAPSLAVFNSTLYLAFVANNAGNELLVCSSPDGSHWAGNTPTSQYSPAVPSLAVFNGRLYMAFLSNDPTNRLLVMSSADGVNWTGGTPTSQYSSAAPSLAVFGGRLYMAFKSNDPTNRLLVMSSADGVNWTGGVNIGQATKFAPSLAVFNNTLYVAFIANDAGNEVLVCSSADGTHWTGNLNIGQASKSAPSLAPVILTTGQVRPTYHLLSVLYTPPGTSGGGSSSSVQYATSSTTGTTLSISASVKEEVKVTATLGFNVDIAKLGLTGEFDASTTLTDTASVAVMKSSGYTFTVPGGPVDGIDHDYDVIYLWLNPLLNVTMDPDSNISWQLGVDGPDMIIQYVLPLWLKNPSLMPPGTLSQLQQRGLTTTDFAQILASDPFASGSTAIDANRFLPTGCSFPYNPPAAPGAAPPTLSYTQSNSTTVTNNVTVKVDLQVSSQISAELQKPLSAILKVGNTLDFTLSGSVETSKQTVQSATVTIGGPSYGYTGPTDVLVYWDTMFSSFMFAFVTSQTPAASGTVAGNTGQPLIRAPMTLDVGGHMLTTITDDAGGYRFYGTVQGSGTISVSGQQFPVSAGPGAPPVNLRLRLRNARRGTARSAP